jgi:DNA primase catalytic subunit
MSSDDNQDRERGVRDRIATFVQVAKGKQATDEELQTLRRAVGRLDRLLADVAADEQARRKRAEEEEAQALRAAAERLDQLLRDIARKEAAPKLKLRHRASNT